MTTETTGAEDLSPDRIAEAARTIDPVFLDSPQYVEEQLAAELGRPVLTKIEFLNPLRSFKGRGADFLVRDLPAGGTVVCASGGANFGQAIAYAARRHGLRADVFVPADASRRGVKRVPDAPVGRPGPSSGSLVEDPPTRGTAGESSAWCGGRRGSPLPPRPPRPCTRTESRRLAVKRLSQRGTCRGPRPGRPSPGSDGDGRRVRRPPRPTPPAAGHESPWWEHSGHTGSASGQDTSARRTAPRAVPRRCRCHPAWPAGRPATGGR
ncbi:pyridoxal-phosphate dependent enzyme [Nocardiopsis halotolerans]|uniref:pyridoxal-phosphate dependent enzyme n=1 Tax=Nocardiopsis halotolerans TaxID=124252 RepID=UPI0009FE9391|nr:pyridoxal-phosphate dependent enzyme [Nocardiopsis halotolerans]